MWKKNLSEDNPCDSRCEAWDSRHPPMHHKIYWLFNIHFSVQSFHRSLPRELVCPYAIKEKYLLRMTQQSWLEIL